MLLLINWKDGSIKHEKEGKQNECCLIQVQNIELHPHIFLYVSRFLAI